MSEIKIIREIYLDNNQLIQNAMNYVDHELNMWDTSTSIFEKEKTLRILTALIKRHCSNISSLDNTISIQKRKTHLFKKAINKILSGSMFNEFISEKVIGLCVVSCCEYIITKIGKDKISFISRIDSIDTKVIRKQDCKKILSDIKSKISEIDTISSTILQYKNITRYYLLRLEIKAAKIYSRLNAFYKRIFENDDMKFDVSIKSILNKYSEDNKDVYITHMIRGDACSHKWEYIESKAEYSNAYIYSKTLNDKIEVLSKLLHGLVIMIFTPVCLKTQYAMKEYDGMNFDLDIYVKEFKSIWPEKTEWDFFCIANNSKINTDFWESSIARIKGRLGGPDDYWSNASNEPVEVLDNEYCILKNITDSYISKMTAFPLRWAAENSDLHSNIRTKLSECALLCSVSAKTWERGSGIYNLATDFNLVCSLIIHLKNSDRWDDDFKSRISYRLCKIYDELRHVRRNNLLTITSILLDHILKNSYGQFHLHASQIRRRELHSLKRLRDTKLNSGNTTHGCSGDASLI